MHSAALSAKGAASPFAQHRTPSGAWPCPRESLCLCCPSRASHPTAPGRLAQHEALQQTTMDDRTELHWRYLKDNLDHSRHHEVLRATGTNIIVAVSTGGFAVIGFDKCISGSDIPLVAFLFCLGVFGSLFTVAQTERTARYYARARALRDEIDRSPVGTEFARLKELGDAAHEARHPRLSRLKLVLFWASIHASISVLAVLLFLLWLTGNTCQPQ